MPSYAIVYVQEVLVVLGGGHLSKFSASGATRSLALCFLCIDGFGFAPFFCGKRKLNDDIR